MCGASARRDRAGIRGGVKARSAAGENGANLRPGEPRPHVHATSRAHASREQFGAFIAGHSLLPLLPLPLLRGGGGVEGTRGGLVAATPGGDSRTRGRSKKKMRLLLEKRIPLRMIFRRRTRTRQRVNVKPRRP